MKSFIKNAITKKILIIFVTIIMVSNFIMPNYVQASVGEDLVEGIMHLVVYLGDVGIKIMQLIMIGDSDIKDGEYNIKYSPGVIFSNVVPALSIDFFSNKEQSIVIEEIKSSVNVDELQGEALDNFFNNMKNNGIKKGDFILIKRYTQFNKRIPKDIEEKFGYKDEGREIGSGKYPILIEQVDNNANADRLYSQYINSRLLS